MIQDKAIKSISITYYTIFMVTKTIWESSRRDINVPKKDQSRISTTLMSTRHGEKFSCFKIYFSRKESDWVADLSMHPCLWPVHKSYWINYSHLVAPHVHVEQPPTAFSFLSGMWGNLQHNVINKNLIYLVVLEKWIWKTSVYRKSWKND